MNYTFRPAITSEAKPLIGIYGLSGSGKTLTALLLAKGFVGDMTQVGMIETESGRGEVYADDPVVGGYQVLSLRDTFSPAAYGEAIDAAAKAGLKALIIDSASHEWEGSGGVLDMASQNEASGKKGMIVWQRPKIEHQQKFMLKLMQTPIPLVIVCMRAKYPMKQGFENGKKTLVRSEFMEPKQSDDILFEMMVHGYVDENHNFNVTKYTKDSFKSIFINGKPITVETGQRLAAWSAGISNETKIDYSKEIRDALAKANIAEVDFLKVAKQSDLSHVQNLTKALAWIEQNKQPAIDSESPDAKETVKADAVIHKTFEEVKEMIEKSDNQDVLDLAKGYIKTVEGSMKQAELQTMVNKKFLEFVERK